MTAQPAHIARVTERDGEALPTIGTGVASAATGRAGASPSILRLVLPYPISANRYWGTRVLPKKGSRRAMAITYVTDEARAYKDDVGRLALMAGPVRVLKIRRAGSALPPMPRYCTSRIGFSSTAIDGHTSSMCEPSTRSLPFSKW